MSGPDPRSPSMRRQPLHVVAWYAVNLALLLSLVVLIAGAAWEYSTRRYLEGFVSAIVPLEAGPVRKTEAILTWMREGPPRLPGTDPESVSERDPEGILNHGELLAVCGTATNAFVNLATTTGLQARRLLLLSERSEAKHVVAELWVQGRWVVVDPTTRHILRDASGARLTVQELRDPRVFAEMVERTPGYDPSWTFERTTYIRLERIPYLGGPLRSFLDRVDAGWEERISWATIVERPSFALFLAGGVLFVLSAVARWSVSWYCETRLGFRRVRLRDRFAHMAFAFMNGSR